MRRGISRFRKIRNHSSITMLVIINIAYWLGNWAPQRDDLGRERTKRDNLVFYWTTIGKRVCMRHFGLYHSQSVSHVLLPTNPAFLNQYLIQNSIQLTTLFCGSCTNSYIGDADVGNCCQLVCHHSHEVHRSSSTVVRKLVFHLVSVLLISENFPNMFNQVICLARAIQLSHLNTLSTQRWMCIHHRSL